MSEDTSNSKERDCPNKDEILFPDLVELWKNFYFKNESSWSEVFNEFLTKDNFVFMLDKTLDHYLSNEKIIRQNMDKYFERSGFPSKKDLARVAEMVIAIEDKVEVLDYQLVEAVKSMANNMLNMAESQKKARDEIHELRKDIADLNKNIDRLYKKASSTPKEPRTPKTSPSKVNRKGNDSGNELIS